MNMSLKKSDINILIILLGILIPVGVYFFVYNSFTEKTAALNAANEGLQQEVDYLQELADNKEQYIADTETMQASIEEIKTHFPAEYKPEDDILYIIGVEDTYGAEVSAIGMGMPAIIEVAQPTPEVVAEPAEGEEGAEGDTVEVAAPTISLYTTPVTVAMRSSYRSLKEIIEYLNTDSYRKSIDTLSVVFDTETGELASSMAFSAYSLTGTEKVYETPAVNGVFYGTGDIFKTGEKSAAILAEKKAAEEAAEGEEE